MISRRASVEIARGHVLLRVGQARGIDEMAAGEPELLRLLVHLLGEGLLASREPFGNHHAGVVTRLHGDAQREVIDAHPAAHLHEHLRAAGAPGLLAHRERVLELDAPFLEALEQDVERHHLAHRRRRHAHVGVLGEKHGARLVVDHDGLLGRGVDARERCLRAARAREQKGKERASDKNCRPTRAPRPCRSMQAKVLRICGHAMEVAPLDA